MSTLRATAKMALFTVLTLLATGLLASTIANRDTRETTPYRAVFVDAVNLNKGDEVRLAGVRVGSIKSVRLYQGVKAMVTFGVDRTVPLTTSTTAVIRYRNLIGSATSRSSTARAAAASSGATRSSPSRGRPRR